MTTSQYRLHDGNTLDLAAVTEIGPIRWINDGGRAGAVGEFTVTESGRGSRQMRFGVSSLVGAFRFMSAVHEFSERGADGCPARQAYYSLEAEARRMLEMHHGDLVAAWRIRTNCIARAA